MLDLCRIIVAGTLLFGSTIHSSLMREPAPDRRPSRMAEVSAAGMPARPDARVARPA